MYRARFFFTRTSLRRLSVRVLAGAAVCVGATTAAHASRAADGLAIYGSPPQSATVGQAYSFIPTVSNPKNRTLSFRIWDMPRWLTFSPTTGSLSGTPTAADVRTYSPANILIGVCDGIDCAYIEQEFAIKISAAGTSAADKPSISGTPPTAVVAGAPYTFQPTASGPAGMTLSFSVQNKPAWANFSIATGQLTGTPSSTQTGSYSNIVLSVSDGQASSALAPFTISVAAATATTGSATLKWVPPTQNTNGSALTNLAGIILYYGTTPTTLTQSVQLASTTQTSYTIGNLAAGTWYFGSVAYTNSGMQSAMSRVVSMSVQ
jgi:putative Ig domain-containing protein